MSHAQRLVLGGYTRGPDRAGVAKGIAVCAFDPQTGGLSVRSSVDDAEQASWVEGTADDNFLFAVVETHANDGEVHGYRWADRWRLERVSAVSALGKGPCHLAATGDRVFAACYSSGLLSGFEADGASLRGGWVVAAYEGSGPHADRQEQPHAHQAVVSPDGRWLCVCDLGTDRVHVHDLRSPSAGVSASVGVEPGAGPRHLAFHPALPIAYLWCELKPVVVTLTWEASSGGLACVGSHDLAADFGLEGVGAGAAIEVHPGGEAVVVSERKTGAVVLLGLSDGELDGRATRFECGAIEPREVGFSPCGGWLLVACQESDWVRSYRLEEPMRPADAPSGEVRWRMPVCLRFC
jgi:6-phosphogluconolactonase